MTDELSPSEAARRIGATTRSVQRWIATGRLPARRVGGRWRVASDALDAFSAQTSVARAQNTSAAPDAGTTIDLRTWSAPGIRTLFVANRGEIARRIARTAERMGIRIVVPVTDGPGALDLLDVDAVVGAAVASGADAVHPGFGFLAEHAEFAAAVIDAGLLWVGPPPDAIRAMGDKAAARHLASRLGVPTVPGYDAPGQSDRALLNAARRIGLPILVKPAGGGGGKGMRVVRDASTLRDALASARREARAAFGDDRLILERLVEGGRHVEVQVLFDRKGHGIHLGERDCSTQRRHQKVLEETPSPAVDEPIRSRLTDAALRLAAAVGYESAGTCEFLLTDRGEVFFLEMNTRLQVEHPVTELVTGLDLVELQLRIAAGEPLPVSQADVDASRRAGGHAVEVRLYAEDAERGFLPATGRVERLRWPAGPEVRVDAGIDEGEAVTGRFDPMLAKVIAHGPDRDSALDRLAGALDATVILGLVTNLRFLRWLVREPVIREGQMRVDTLDRIWPPDDWADRTAVPDTAWEAAARALLRPPGVAGTPRGRSEADTRSAEPAAWSDGWRLNAPPRARVATLDEADGGERTVVLDPAADAAAVGLTGPIEVVVADPEPAAATARGEDAAGALAYVDVAGRSVGFRLAPPPDVDRAVRSAEAHASGAAAELVAPMPGAVLTVHRSAGDAVVAGNPVVTLEAMKMEHVVEAPATGVIAEIAVKPGDQVTRGQRLASLRASEAEASAGAIAEAGAASEPGTAGKDAR